MIMIFFSLTVRHQKVRKFWSKYPEIDYFWSFGKTFFGDFDCHNELKHIYNNKLYENSTIGQKILVNLPGNRLFEDFRKLYLEWVCQQAQGDLSVFIAENNL